MNKEKFIEKLQSELNYNKDKCIIINNIVENTFLIGKKNKEKMIEKFSTELNISSEEANNIYETVMSILGKSLKEKIKHPFKDLDEK